MFPIVEKYHFPRTEQTLPTLLDDLDERGLLDDTLVLWMGEFGRTPKINDNISRDHWPQCYTVLLAGGGVKRGFVYGKSDATGIVPRRAPRPARRPRRHALLPDGHQPREPKSATATTARWPSPASRCWTWWPRRG